MAWIQRRNKHPLLAVYRLILIKQIEPSILKIHTHIYTGIITNRKEYNESQNSKKNSLSLASITVFEQSLLYISIGEVKMCSLNMIIISNAHTHIHPHTLECRKTWTPQKTEVRAGAM
jgi:hypothetical protein